MKKKNALTLLVISGLCAFKLLVHWYGNQNYGFHRDELLHLAAGDHPAWGYFEFPPFIAWLGALSEIIFNHSLMGTRFMATLAGVGVIIFCCLMAREMGGKQYAILLSGVCILAFLPYYRNHTLFQPVAFDQLFWTMGFYFLVKYLANPKAGYFLLAAGITAGLGFLNKYTILIWMIGVGIAFLTYKRLQFYRSGWTWAGVVASLIIMAPNIYWQYINNFPVTEHLQQLSVTQLQHIGQAEFLTDQLSQFLPILIAATGFVATMRSEKLKEFKPMGLAFISILLLMWGLQAKSYYFFAAYPVMFAAGSVMIEHWLRKRPVFNYALAGFMLVFSLPFVPYMSPVLPLEAFELYADLEVKENRVQLTSDYADMFGWQEQVTLVDSIYRSYPKEERGNINIWAENYGEAGAIAVLGDRRLPYPASRHGSFWSWGPRNDSAQIWISIGNEASAVEGVFRECRLIKKIQHTYAIDEENNIPVYVCTDPVVDIKEWWASYRPHIFE